MEGHAGPAWAAALEASGLGVLMRESAVLYPLANIAHILGLVLFVGSILLLDLRLVGFARSLPALDVARVLTPIMFTGFAVQIVSGVLLFSADARPLWNNPVMQVKAALIALGLANALIFRALWNRRLADWDDTAPGVARTQAGLSLLTWLGVAVCGRFAGYF
jgi:formate-dependent nitrite reductase membrane component NrfD